MSGFGLIAAALVFAILAAGRLPEPGAAPILCYVAIFLALVGAFTVCLFPNG